MSQEFADILRRTREKRGLSQSQLAEKTGLQPSAVSHFEAGRRAPSFSNLRHLADALGVSIDFLIGRQRRPQPAGPAAERLFRDFAQLSSEDQDMLARFAKTLAERNKGQREGDQGDEREAGST